MNRIVIIGNSGSGKSYLAQKLSNQSNKKLIHFDHLFWEPGGFTQKRPKDVVYSEIKNLSEEDDWIMEGVFGDLAEIALQRANSLIFIDKSWKDCEAGLLQRGFNPSDENTFKELLLWAKNYWTRENKNSFLCHERLFNAFPLNKTKIQSNQEMEKLCTF